MDRDQPRALTGRHSRRDSAALWEWDVQSSRIQFSPQWVALVGYEDHEFGSTLEDWLRRIHPDDRTRLLRELECARAGDADTFACRYRLRHEDGTFRWMSCRGTVIRDSAGGVERLTGAQSDVTAEMATDLLTGLPNRLVLADRVAYSIERIQGHKDVHFAVLLIDVGRPVSLERSSRTALSGSLLTAVARRLEACLQPHDLVARVDGSCFAILIDSLRRSSEANTAADRLLAEMLKPFMRDGREVWLTASIGMAVSGSGYTHAEHMLRDAKIALHRARVLGGSRWELQGEGDREPARRIAGPRLAFAVALLTMVLSTGLVFVLLSAGAVVVVNQSQPSVVTPLPPPLPPKVTTIARPVDSPETPSVVVATNRKKTPRVPSPTASMDVVHLHRFGSCRGRLEVTRDRVMFRATGGTSDDAFMLEEFRHLFSDDTLTVRTPDRTYRFKAAGSRRAETIQLRDLANRITRSRRS
jgi:diguanylate cyclase (GGDEF)-like protein/PAS domain S-box-containing protein